LYASAELASLQ